MRLIFLFTLMSCCYFTHAQINERPRLVTGLVVDQMCYAYLERYWDKFDEGGFKRLVTQGYRFDQMQFNYMSTYTGPGHASIYTGTTPAVHGIIDNN